MSHTGASMYCVYQIIHLSGFPEEKYNASLSLMPAERRRAVERLRFIADRKRTAAGEYLTRGMLSRICGIRPEEITFGRTEHGKPFAKGLPVEFSVSHSGERILCAVSDRPVGADIERVRPVSDRLIHRVCTAGEQSYLNENGISPQERTRRFFLVWTGKEAYFKYLGTGITSLSGADTCSDEIHSGLTQFFLEDYAVSIFSQSSQKPVKFSESKTP